MMNGSILVMLEYNSLGGGLVCSVVLNLFIFQKNCENQIFSEEYL